MSDKRQTIVVFFDQNKKELIGSGSYIRPDQRKTPNTILDELTGKKHNDWCIDKRARSFRIGYGGVRNPTFYINIIDLNK